MDTVDKRMNAIIYPKLKMKSTIVDISPKAQLVKSTQHE
jgi:hypothetical protein